MTSSIDSVDLIPRAAIFGVPERGPCQISPCGRWLAFVAPLDGVMNLWVCDVTDDPGSSFDSARPVTADRARGVNSFAWTYDGVHLIYMQDNAGDENTHLFAVPAAGGEARDLTPFPGARATVHAISPAQRGVLLVSINHRDPRFPDIYRLTLATGELELSCENPGYRGFISDDDYRQRLAIETLPDGSMVIRTRDADGWVPWQTIPKEDFATTRPLHLSHDGSVLYVLDSRGRDTAALVAFELEDRSGEGRLIAQHPGADVSGLWSDPVTQEPLAWTAVRERRELHILDDRIREDVRFLEACDLGEWDVASATEDDGVWIIAASTDVNPLAFHHYVRSTRSLTKLYDTRPRLTGTPLVRMRSTTLRSRDGLDLISYLTLPAHADTGANPADREPLPMVLLVHGGPIERDTWGYRPHHQWLANRGYAVLSVNFRGSSGLGKHFVAAGYGEWGGKMDDDLVDAVRWAIAERIADPERICIMGGSYGGYATLWGMTSHPELYACGVDIVGPSNLETLAASMPAYWESARQLLYSMVGDPRTPEGLALMRERSPVHRAGRIAAPLLIGHGANDPRVKLDESEQMVAAMKENGVPVTYVLYPDEGHGFVRPANGVRFNAIAEAFLAEHLGGRAEPLAVGEAEGSTAVVDGSPQ